MGPQSCWTARNIALCIIASHLGTPLWGGPGAGTRIYNRQWRGGGGFTAPVPPPEGAHWPTAAPGRAVTGAAEGSGSRGSADVRCPGVVRSRARSPGVGSEKIPLRAVAGDLCPVVAACRGAAGPWRAGSQGGCRRGGGARCPPLPSFPPPCSRAPDPKGSRDSQQVKVAYWEAECSNLILN